MLLTIVPFTEINLDDDYTADDLMVFWLRYWHCGVKVAAELFPERPDGFRAVAHMYAQYASNKAAAKRMRSDGNIPRALVYEKICDRIYNEIPKPLRGW